MSDIDNQIRHVLIEHHRRAAELMPSPQQGVILDVLRAHSEPTPATAIAAATGYTIQHTNVLLRRLRLLGYLKRLPHHRKNGGIEYHYEVTGCN